MQLNLEQTVEWLVQVAQSGVKPDKWLTYDQLNEYLTQDNVGKYYIVSKDGTDHLYYITRRHNDGLIALDLGKYPAVGPQGLRGEQGPSPVVTISPSTGNWVIDGVDTGKPSRGKQGEKGNTGMQGVPGISVRDMLSIDSTAYAPTITDDGNYQNVESSAEIKYSDGGVEQSTQVDFNIKVPDHETFAGDGLTKNGRTLSVDRNMTPVYDDFGHYAGLVPMTTGDRVWGQALVSNDPVPYAIAQRNDSGGLTGIQDKLYLHVGRILMNGYTYYYKLVNRREDAFINTETGFTDEEPDNYVFLVSSGGQNNRTLLDFKYDSWDEKHYFHVLSAPQTQSGYVAASLTYDYVYEI